MTVTLSFVNLNNESDELQNEIDIGIENNVSLDLNFSATDELQGDREYIGHIYKNDRVIGEFGITSARGKYIEWYAGSGTPNYVKNGDVFKAVLIPST